jgi:hypothetical protein
MEFESLPDQPAPAAPQCLVSFLALNPGCGWVPEQVAFLHQRSNSAGNRRLVEVSVHSIGGDVVPRYQNSGDQNVSPQDFPGATTPARPSWPRGSIVELPWYVRVPGSLRTRAYNAAAGYACISLGRGTTYTIYGGQADANDSSHFTIRYEVEEGSGTIDGWLQADDQVRFKIRDGPATYYEQSPESLLE